MRAANRNLFRLTRFLIFNLPGICRFLAKFKTTKKRLLIIKTDAIGDYILFRNFIEVVKNSELYGGHEIHLLGNSLWQDIALKFDSQFISSFIFINSEALYEAPLKVFKLAFKLFANNYEVVWHPTSSRTFICDGLAAFTAAPQIVGFKGDTHRIREDYKSKTDKFYTQLLSPPLAAYFEFERSKFFFETILRQNISINGPQIPVNNTAKNGIVIFPGSGVMKRNWEPEKFLALLQLILQNTSQPIYLAGSNTEIALCNFLMENLPPEHVRNLAGKTSLVQLIELIAGAALLISNETSAIHIAAAVKTKSVCVLGGGHFNRFMPYRNNDKCAPVCVYEKMDCYHCDWNCKFITDTFDPFPCIAAISVENVWQETFRSLKIGS